MMEVMGGYGAHIKFKLMMEVMRGYGAHIKF